MAILVLTCSEEQLVLDLLGQVPLVHEGNQVAIPGDCFNDITLKCRIQLAIENDSLQTQELLDEIERTVGEIDPRFKSFRAALIWVLKQC